MGFQGLNPEGRLSLYMFSPQDRKPLFKLMRVVTFDIHPYAAFGIMGSLLIPVRVTFACYTEASGLPFRNSFHLKSVGICCMVAREGKGFFSLPVGNKIFLQISGITQHKSIEIHGVCFKCSWIFHVEISGEGLIILRLVAKHVITPISMQSQSRTD